MLLVVAFGAASWAVDGVVAVSEIAPVVVLRETVVSGGAGRGIEKAAVERVARVLEGVLEEVFPASGLELVLLM